jgi:hypothetical protein
MILTHMSERILEVKILGGDWNRQTAFIPRISLTPTADSAEFTFMLRQRQFPVHLAFAMSINKAQGQSIKYVGLDLCVPVFSHGQLYVALSHATSCSRIKVLLPPNIMMTTNIVYPEVLIW